MNLFQNMGFCVSQTLDLLSLKTLDCVCPKTSGFLLSQNIGFYVSHFLFPNIGFPETFDILFQKLDSPIFQNFDYGYDPSLLFGQAVNILCVVLFEN
jgi:hypothetical protein